MKTDLITRLTKTLFVSVLVLLSVVTAMDLLYSAFCFCMHGKFKLLDFGVYTNMIWNSGHGALFRYVLERNYLYTHLSYSLALLGPLFLVWDHPLLLMVVQWMAICGGAVILYMAARRHSIPAEMALALMFFFMGYRLTQSAAMCEFHGVAMLMLFVPWLYYCCSFSKRWAWLPLVLILGVREDAFLCVLPVLLYFAVKDRWKAGYVLFAATLLYGLLAIFVIYPHVNGISIFERRARFMRPVGDFGFTEADVRSRFFGLAITLLPVLVVFGRRSFPAFIMPSVAYLVTIFSAYHVQQAIGSHYSPPVMSTLAIGLVESLHIRRKLKVNDRYLLRAAALVVLTILVHLHSGFLFGGGKNSEVFNTVPSEGIWSLRAAKYIPKDGVLLTHPQMASYCANRKDLLCWNKWYDPGRQHFDLVFLKMTMIPYEEKGVFAEMLRDGRLGVAYYDGMFVVLERGGDTTLNEKVLQEMRMWPVIFAETPRHAGKNVILGDGRMVRYWEGEGHRAPVTLSYGSSRKLKAGSYQAVFRYYTASPRRTAMGNSGKFSVHRLNDQAASLAEAGIMNLVSGGSVFLKQAIPFKIDREMGVEVRVTGGDAELWLDKVVFSALE